MKWKLFCFQLLRLSDAALLRRISHWTFTDEKWWDLVGPAPAKWIKVKTKMERKMQNQVCFFETVFCVSSACGGDIWSMYMVTMCGGDMHGDDLW